MSWYEDTQLFIYNGLSVYRIKKGYGSRIHVETDFEDFEELSFSKHLDYRECQYADFISSFCSNGLYNHKAINRQGLVFHRDEGTWSREEQNSLFYDLPGIANYETITAQLAAEAKQVFKDKVPELEAKISSLQDEAKNNKEEKQAMDKRVADLEAEYSTLKDEVKRLTDMIAHAGRVRKEKQGKLRFGATRYKGQQSKSALQ